MPSGISSIATVRCTGSSGDRWSASAHKRIAIIGTRGSIATLVRSSVDLVDYGQFGHVISIASLFERSPELNRLATFKMTDFRAVHSEAIGPIEWSDLAETTERLISTDSPDGIVIVHGTSTLMSRGTINEMKKFSHVPLYASRRSPVLARNVVAASQPLAVQAGLNMLQQGRNAVDAALAAAVTLVVVEPTGNGLGSDAYCILWDGHELHGLNASGRSPAAWTPGRFSGRDAMPLRGWDSVRYAERDHHVSAVIADDMEARC
jgi:hypothetical protein